MMIAVASEGKEVSPHFGHCANFNIYTEQDGKIAGEENVISPGHDHNLIDFLDERGVAVILSGGMGAGAREKFAAKNIEVVTGASGDAKEAAQAYLSGELKTDGAAGCAEHGGHCRGH